MEIAKRAEQDPSVWQDLHYFGWDELMRLETEWRSVPGWPHIFPNWVVVYKYLRSAFAHTTEYRQYRRDVLERDGRCVKCKATELVRQLQVHHIKSWFGYPGLRLNPRNGQTLCKQCHKEEPSSSWLKEAGAKR